MYQKRSPSIAGQVRQGDVLVTPILSIPDGAMVVPHNGRIVLATGEATGHAHAIAVDNEEDVRLLEKGDERFLEVKSPATLRHEEHSALTITATPKRVIRQEEYSGEDEYHLVRD